MHRIKKLINCDRASVFIRSEEKRELTTILAEGSEQITIPADVASIAGECAVHGQVINLKRAYDRDNFNKAIDKKTGYRTNNMLCVPIKDTMGDVVGVLQVSKRNRAARGRTVSRTVLLGRHR